MPADPLKKVFSFEKIGIFKFCEGHNPAILSEHPLTRERNHFRLEIRKLGNWIGIGFFHYKISSSSEGVADLEFLIDGGSTLGTQRKGVNSSYFWQSSGIRKIQMFSEDKQVFITAHICLIYVRKLTQSPEMIY